MELVETWCPIAGYEGAYEVSDLGRVRSLPGGRRRAKILKPVKAGRGYLTVFLSVEGVVRRFYIHYLVAQAFIGPRPLGLEICHGHPDFTDNRVVNLRYDTHHANMRDSIADGTYSNITGRIAFRTHCSNGHELTEENIYYQRCMSADGRGVKVRRRCRKCNRKTERRERRHRAIGPREAEVRAFLVAEGS